MRTIWLLLSGIFTLCSAKVLAQEIRRPEVAGLFYPLDAIALSDSIEHYMASTHEAPGMDDLVIGIIAPHAGYQYSGATAAQAYRQIFRRNIKTVFVLGPSHKQTYRGAALHHAAWWETPLGRLPVDTAIERQLLLACPFIHILDSAFTKEHSIEDQLPFIQESLGEVRIVPIALGEIQMNDLVALSMALWKLVQSREGSAIVVASSDMSHYVPASRTAVRDSIAAHDVLTLDPDKLVTDIGHGSAEFCGYVPVLTLMLIAEQAGGAPHLLGYSTSAHSTGDTNRVIGYGAFGFSLPSTKHHSIPHNEESCYRSPEFQSIRLSLQENRRPFTSRTRRFFASKVHS